MSLCLFLVIINIFLITILLIHLLLVLVIINIFFITILLIHLLLVLVILLSLDLLIHIL